MTLSSVCPQLGSGRCLTSTVLAGERRHCRHIRCFDTTGYATYPSTSWRSVTGLKNLTVICASKRLLAGFSKGRGRRSDADTDIEQARAYALAIRIHTTCSNHLYFGDFSWKYNLSEKAVILQPGSWMIISGLESITIHQVSTRRHYVELRNRTNLSVADSMFHFPWPHQSCSSTSG